MKKTMRIRGIKNTYGMKFVKKGLKRLGVSLSGVSSSNSGSNRGNNARKTKGNNH